MRPALGTPLAVAGAVCTGLAVGVGYLEFDLWPLAWVAFVPLLGALERSSVLRAGLCGWIAGATAVCLGFHWIPDLLVRFAGMPRLLALLLHLVFCTWEGIGFALVALAVSTLGRRRTGLPPLIVFPAALVVVEWFFPRMFPWYVSGSQYRFLPFIQWGEILGAAGLTGILALASASVWEIVAGLRGWIPRGPSRTAAIAILALVPLVLVLGRARAAQVDASREKAPILRVGIIQPNLGIREKRRRSLRDRHLRTLQQWSAATEHAGAELVVWPETSYPYRIHRSVETDHPGHKRIRVGFSIPVLFGAVTHDENGTWNSAYLLGSDGELIGPADKKHLVLFSERVPLRDHMPEAVLERWPDIRYGGFEAGERPEVLAHGAVRVGVLNCFEDIVPGVSRELVSRDANLLVNLTNDAWFGDTVEPRQHMALSTLRAVENRRDLVRAVNTGVSAVVEASGRVAVSTETWQEVVIVHDVRLLEGRTVYQIVGDWPAWLGILVLVLAALWARIRGMPRGRGKKRTRSPVGTGGGT